MIVLTVTDTSCCCDACGSVTQHPHEHDAAGVLLRLCAGCAGELTAFLAYGDEVDCEHDWPAIRERVK